MNPDDSPSRPPHRIRIDLDWRWHRPKHRPGFPKGEPRPDERPIRCIEDATTVGATTTALPYPDASCEFVDCGTVFAYVRNDEGLARELRRAVRPGGTVRIRVPATGPLAVVDAFNLHRYLVDLTKRGLRPFETADIGWRRHYSLRDLTELMDPEAFAVAEHFRYGVAASEAIRLSGFALFRWLRPSRDRYRAVSRFAERVLERESAVVWRHGYWLDCTFQRKQQAPADAAGAS